MKTMKMVKLRLLLVGLLLLPAAPAWAHVGSPDVFFDGAAGPYPVRVIVRPPAVIPGLAEVTVRLRDGRKVDAVTVQPIQFRAGFRGAPPPDEAKPVPGAPDTWSGQLWLMVGSTYSVRVRVAGPAGSGEALVPVVAVPQRVLTMAPGLGWTLAALGLFLFAGAASIVGAAVREGSLEPDEAPDPARRRRARIVTAAAAAVLALALWGGKRWWDGVAAEARSELYKPFHVTSAVRLQGGRPVLSLAVDDERRTEWSPLMPDHGKLMHLFLLREPGFDAFAHIHPVPAGEGRFQAVLPPLPAGSYRLYADVVHESGFSQTLVDTVRIPASGEADASSQAPAPDPPDPDDSWLASAPLPALAPRGPKMALLEGGGSILWHPEPLAAGQETTLRFEVRDADGRPAVLEPYMGMASHAVIARDARDGGRVFVHLHPMGTINMAAQEAFVKKEAEEEGGGAQPAMPAMDHAAMGHGGVLSFPYEFPRPGRYRLWVQVKIAGQVRTGVFDAEVAELPATSGRL